MPRHQNPETSEMARLWHLLLVASLLATAGAAKMPSCEDDTGAHCLGDDADMSPEGIDKVMERVMCETDAHKLTPTLARTHSLPQQRIVPCINTRGCTLRYVRACVHVYPRVCACAYKKGIVSVQIHVHTHTQKDSDT